MKRSKREVSGEYAPPTGSEAETEPGSGGRVLRNRMGIRRKSEMDRVEFEALLRTQEAYLHRLRPTTRFTAKWLRAMHRDWLGEIYAWAGEYRTVEMAKAGFHWPPAFRVAPNMENFEARTLKRCTPCRPAPLDVVARQMAEVHAELLLIHPFRDGNGRLARWLAGAMALQAGYASPLYRFEGMGSKSERTRYLTAVKRGYVGELDLLAGFFVEAVLRREPPSS